MIAIVPRGGGLCAAGKSFEQFTQQKVENKMNQHNRAARLCRLFFSTLYISSFTFGGGFVIVTLMKKKFVDELHWITEEEMLDMTALAESAPLTIADDDFNRLSGGTVIAPNGATEDNLTTEDTSSDGQITRQYYFGGTPVGTAILEDAEQQTNDAAVTGQKNMEAAQAYSASHTTAPYYIIGAIGAAFLLFFLFLMIKVIKS